MTNKIVIIIVLFAALNCGCVSQEMEKPNYKTIPVCGAWSMAEDLSGMDHWEKTAKYDLLFHDTWPLIEVGWNQADALPYRGLITKLYPSTVQEGLEHRKELKEMNPDIKLLVALEYREGGFKSIENEGKDWWEKGFFPPDSPYWLEDENGDRVIGWGEDTNLNGKIDDQDEILTYLVDFSNSEVQDLVAERAASLYESTVFDGIFFDWMAEWPTTDDATKKGWDTILSMETELEARKSLIKKVREKTSDDFIIMGNTNWGKKEILVPLINAVFMECYKGPYNTGYSDEQLQRTQEAVIFNQNNLMPPAIVCLEGWRICYEYDADKKTRIVERETEENLQMMRFFTTMSLTLTNGCVLFSDDNAIPHTDHAHNFYNFWEAPLGYPVSEYQLLYNDIENLYIREFENGWAVYNFSGMDQKIKLPKKAVSVSEQKTGRTFTVPDKDGEIFIR